MVNYNARHGAFISICHLAIELYIYDSPANAFVSAVLVVWLG